MHSTATLVPAHFRGIIGHRCDLKTEPHFKKRPTMCDFQSRQVCLFVCLFFFFFCVCCVTIFTGSACVKVKPIKERDGFVRLFRLKLCFTF